MSEEYSGGESRCLERSPAVGTWLCMQAFFYSRTMDKEKNWPPVEIGSPLGCGQGTTEQRTGVREEIPALMLTIEDRFLTSLYLHIFNTEVCSMRYGTPKAHQSPFFQDLVMSVDTPPSAPDFAYVLCYKLPLPRSTFVLTAQMAFVLDWRVNSLNSQRAQVAQW